mmetsp:Transcript_5812/g.14937  ORF Transcript_5812/g.14937 Transcript_5812/m.14937 type:complete len:169 (-) Transcript_5812:157-663(-)
MVKKALAVLALACVVCMACTSTVSAKRHRPPLMLTDMFGSEFIDFPVTMYERARHQHDPVWPKFDVVERDNDYVLKADVPGYDKDKLKLEVHQDTVTLSAKSEDSKEENKDGSDRTLRRERSICSFSRSIQLPSKVDDEDVKASYKDGVLTVELPKSKESLPKAVLIA